MDDDGDVADRADQTAYNAKKNRWMCTYPPPTVSQVFSDVGNPYMFQGRPHFALAAGDWPPYPTTILLNDHRLRLSDPVTGRWLTRDPIGYDAGTMNLYEGLLSNPMGWLDPFGLDCEPANDTDSSSNDDTSSSSGSDASSAQSALNAAVSVINDPRNHRKMYHFYKGNHCFMTIICEDDDWECIKAADAAAQAHDVLSDLPDAVKASSGTSGIKPKRTVYLCDPKHAGAAYLAPDKTVYVAQFHIKIAEYLYAHGIWKSLSDPGVSGWLYGILTDSGTFMGGAMG